MQIRHLLGRKTISKCHSKARRWCLHCVHPILLPTIHPTSIIRSSQLSKLYTPVYEPNLTTNRSSNHAYSLTILRLGQTYLKNIINKRFIKTSISPNTCCARYITNHKYEIESKRTLVYNNY